MNKFITGIAALSILILPTVASAQQDGAAASEQAAPGEPGNCRVHRATR